jgi:uncharacterized protein (DUF433 family)
VYQQANNPTDRREVNVSLPTTSRYVTRNPKILHGEPIIVGTRTPVRAIVELWRSSAQPEEIFTQLPYLTLAQIFDALSFYQDNQAEINDYIERNRIPDELVHPLVRAAMQQL